MLLSVILLVYQYKLLMHVTPGLGNWLEIVGALLCFIASFIGALGPLYAAKSTLQENEEYEVVSDNSGSD